MIKESQLPGLDMRNDIHRALRHCIDMAPKHAMTGSLPDLNGTNDHLIPSFIAIRSITMCWVDPTPAAP